MFCGAKVYYLQKPPVPAVLLKAMKTVRPTTILSVPLIIEKIYKGSVLPTINKSRTLRWMNVHANKLMCRLTFFGIGGAKLDGEGEVAIKGPNVMLGYYKDPKRTKSVFTEDGWFRTNDLAVQDEKGRFYIKGRKSNMILGASGENIYPEEIESVFNNQEGVTESIVIERNGRLVALVQPCDGFIDWDAEGEDRIYEKIDAWKAKLLKKVNKNVNKTSQVSSIEVMKELFEKTATMKIRRFKYKDSAPTVEAERAAEAGKDSKNTDSCLK